MTIAETMFLKRLSLITVCSMLKAYILIVVIVHLSAFDAYCSTIMPTRCSTVTL